MRSRRHGGAMQKNFAVLAASRNFKRIGSDSVRETGYFDFHRPIESVSTVHADFQLPGLARIEIRMIGREHQSRLGLGRLYQKLVRKILSRGFPEIANLHLVAASFLKRLRDAGIF